MKDIIKYTNKLIKISDDIIREIDVLANLSYSGKENTEVFLEHLNYIKEYLNKERIILNNIDLDNLNKIYTYLLQHDDMSDGHARTIIAVLDKMAEFDEDETNYEVKIDELNLAEDTEWEDITTEYDILSEYMKEVNETEKHQDSVTDYFATVAIKKMLSRINNVYTDNKGDRKYKERLAKYFNFFKYYYFTIDNKLERLGANYNFNVEAIPIALYPNIDITNICNNECVNIINEMYSINNYEYALDKISKALFQTITFEEYLNALDNDTCNSLLELCYKLDKVYTNSFYGNIAKNKLLSRKKN